MIYTASLFAAADAETRHVVIHEMRLEVEGRPDIVVRFTPHVAAAFKRLLAYGFGCRIPARDCAPRRRQHDRLSARIHKLLTAVLWPPDFTLSVQVPLSTPEQVAAAEATPIVVKEGVTYVTKIAFSVHKDVVLGLKFATVVSYTTGSHLRCECEAARLTLATYNSLGLHGGVDGLKRYASWCSCMARASAGV